MDKINGKTKETTETTCATCSVCGKSAELKCSVCKEVAYCCKDHQKKDWKTHKNLCRPFEIQISEVIGRHLLATRDIPEGAVIICEFPLIVGPKTYTDFEVKSIPCVGCYIPLPVSDPPGRCINCGWPSCGTHCLGLQNPREHGTECPVLKLRSGFAINNIDDFYRYYALMPLRCLLLQKKDPKKWKQLMEMESHFDKRGPNTEIYQIIEENIVNYLYSHYIAPLKEYEKEKNIEIIKDCSRETIHKICGIIDVNSLDIHLNNGSDISGLYPTAYLMEHSCVPNTKYVFEDNEDPSKKHRIIVKAARLIKKGEHIKTMYTHALWGTQARRDHLRETKYFSCECERCKDPTELGTYISALKCMGVDERRCDGYQLPINPLDNEAEWACNKCNIRVDSNTAAFLTAQFGDEVDALLAKGPSVRELEELLEKLLQFLHPNHYHVYTVKHSLVQLYGYQQGYLPKDLTDAQLKRKATMCREMIAITNKIDPYVCRLALYQAVSYHELHLAQFELIKRKWADQCFEKDREPYREQLKECRVLLQKAKDALKDEVIGSAGYKLVHEIFTESHRQLEKWIEDMKVAI